MLDHPHTPSNDAVQSVKRHPVDEQPKPLWATASDGKKTKIEGNVRFEIMWQQWLDDACDHPRKVVVGWVNAGGATVYKRYCYDCGCTLSQAIKHEDAQREGIHDVSLDRIASISNAYVSQREAHLKGFVADAADHAQPENRASYDDYLRSPQWKRKASLIMQRANHRCEGCLSRPATQVHHLTYKHKFHEFAFELIAVCETCHDRLHHGGAA